MKYHQHTYKHVSFVRFHCQRLTSAKRHVGNSISYSLCGQIVRINFICFAGNHQHLSNHPFIHGRRKQMMNLRAVYFNCLQNMTQLISCNLSIYSDDCCLSSCKYQCQNDPGCIYFMELKYVMQDYE